MNSESETEAADRREYQTPEIKREGSLSELTLGGAPALPDVLNAGNLLS